MRAKASVYIATSLDRFIARKNGSLDWLDAAATTITEGEDCGFAEFMKTVDTLIMGRKSYEKVLSFGQWPYGNTPVIILSHSPISFPEVIPKTVSHSSETPRELMDRLSKDGIKHVYVDGGSTIQGFLRKGLINQLIITTIPIVLGEGIPLFGPLQNDINLKHLDTKSFDFGFVQSTYVIA